MGRASGIFPAADWHRRGLSWHPSALRVVNAGGSETAAVPDAPFVGEAAAGTLSQGRVYLVLRAESPLPRQECALLRTTRQPPRRGRSGALPRFPVCERMGMTKLEGNPHASGSPLTETRHTGKRSHRPRVWPRPLEAALRPKNGSWPRSPTVQAATWNEAAYELERIRRSEIRPKRYGSFDVVEKRLQFVEESAGMEAVAYAVMHLQSDGHERAVALRKEFSERKDGKRVDVAFL